MNGRVLYEIWPGYELSLVVVWIEFGCVLNEVWSRSERTLVVFEWSLVVVWIKFGRVLHEVVSGSELSLVVF